MKPETVFIVDTSVANIASMRSTLRRLGWSSELTIDAGAVRSAQRVVLPGVGSFESGMRRLGEARLIDPLRDRIRHGGKTLAVCLGMQLLGEASEESPGVDGIGVAPMRALRFPTDVIAPQLGFNEVTPLGPGWIEPGCAYFANSYRIVDEPRGWSIAKTCYGDSFVSAAWRDQTLACQFHPELSGRWGLALLQRWLTDHAAPPSARHNVAGGLKTRIIPCLDIKDGRVVKGVQFQRLRDAGDPAACTRRYQEQGADELVLLDVAATRQNRLATVETIKKVRAELTIPMTVGGGVRSLDDADALLRAGADKVSVNTAAVERPSLLAELSNRLGAQSVVLALDAARHENGWIVLTHAGSRHEPLDAVAWAKRATQLGVGEVLLTSWDRDGSRTGYDLGLIATVSSAIDAPVIASGGADNVEHMRQALRAGAHAVLAASIFHDGDTTVREIKRAISDCGIEVRL